MYVCTNNDDEEWGNKHYTTSVWHRYLWQSEEEPRIPTVCVIYKYIYIYIIYMVLDNIDTHRESAQLLFFVLHCITTIWWFIFFKGMKDACSFLMFWSKSNPCSLSTSTSSSCWSDPLLTSLPPSSLSSSWRTMCNYTSNTFILPKQVFDINILKNNLLLTPVSTSYCYCYCYGYDYHSFHSFIIHWLVINTVCYVVDDDDDGD